MSRINEASKNVMRRAQPAWIATLLSAAVAWGGYPAAALASARSEKSHESDEVVRFELHPNPQFQRCLAQFPDDAQRAPSVEVTVVRGSQNDSLSLRGRNIKPGLKFDLFTVEHTNLAADATVDPAFRGNFGLATYQSDLDASEEGRVRAAIRTILLDENFSFDPTVALAPTGAFNVGFWFDDPDAAVGCGFNPQNPTPFNGDHKAGPLAMISTPDANTRLGPLCTHADTSTTPARCSP
ncbi:MAG TPA: hypothetical protein VEM76_05295 [Anaeromyxobacteraceae bacterium]|nr:hypothetical protein [Anaeromyxobacteraceae bacterium]